MPVESVSFEACRRVAAAALAGSPRGRVADAALYLAHVEGSAPLRRVAEAAGKPVSSVHRAVRRVEALRDDLLLDTAFEAIATRLRGGGSERCDKAVRARRRALAALAAPGAFLMVAARAEKAGVFTPGNGLERPAALVPLDVAADLAARSWIRCAARREASARYVVTEAGRAALDSGSYEDGEEAPRQPQREPGERVLVRADGTSETIRIANAESPLAWLASRKGPDGAPFLRAEDVEAGERLRREAEAGTCARALEALGFGLAEVAYGACCAGEGLEGIERRMGWSARSGKVVLKLALQRLAAHYADGADEAAAPAK